MRMKNPPHPGEIVRDELLRSYGLTVAQAADHLGVSDDALRAVLDGEARLSAELAFRFEKAFGVSMETLLRIQNSWDIARVLEREAEIRVERLAPPDLPVDEGR